MIPVPVVTYTKRKSTQNKGGKTAVITSSPYIKELRLDEENRQLKEQIINMRREMKMLKKSVKLQDTEKDTEKNKKKKKNRSKLVKKPEPSNDDDEDLNSDDEERELGNTNVLKVANEPGSSKYKSTRAKRKLEFNDRADFVVGVINPDKVPDNEIDVANLEKGQFVLVKFANEKVKVCKYYVGYIVDIKSRKNVNKNIQVETKFMERCDLRKRDLMKFKYPDEEDIAEHSASDIMILLPNPKPMGSGKRARVESQWKFDDDRLKNFSPIL